MVCHIIPYYSIILLFIRCKIKPTIRPIQQGSSILQFILHHYHSDRQTIMDKWLKPSRFDCDPSSAGAEKEWKHWERTFQNFIATVDRPASGSQAAVIATSEQKLSALLNFVSSSVYDSDHCISSQTMYYTTVIS